MRCGSFIQIRTLFAALHLHPLLFIRSIPAGSGLARMFMHSCVFFALVLVLYVAPCKIFEQRLSPGSTLQKALARLCR